MLLWILLILFGGIALFVAYRPECPAGLDTALKLIGFLLIIAGIVFFVIWLLDRSGADTEVEAVVPFIPMALMDLARKLRAFVA